MFGILRAKKDFKSRRKKNRPKEFPLTYTAKDGGQVTMTVPVNLYPTTYLAVKLPMPGIFSGATPTDTSPAMELQFKGDEKEINQILEAVPGDAASLSNMFSWGDFCRLLAKIAHGYLVATIGQSGYEPLLPNLILGRSAHLAHYVGGVFESMEREYASYDLALELLEHGDERYLVVCIQLMGRGRLPHYQVVAGRVTDMGALISAVALSYAGR